MEQLLQHWLLMGEAVSGGSLFSNGQGWMLGAAIAMALGTVLIRFTCKQSDPFAVTGWHMIVGSLPLIIWHCFDTKWSLWPVWSNFQWSLMAYSSFLGSALAYGLFFWFARRAGATNSSLVFFFWFIALVYYFGSPDERVRSCNPMFSSY